MEACQDHGWLVRPDWYAALSLAALAPAKARHDLTSRRTADVGAAVENRKPT